MKKIIAYLLCVFILSISCSRDDASTNENITQETNLTKLVKITYPNENSEVRYNYNGNKLSSIICGSIYDGVFYANNIRYEFIYSEDLIVRINIIDPDNVLERYYTFKYDGNKRLIERYTGYIVDITRDKKEFLTYGAENRIYINTHLFNTPEFFPFHENHKLYLNSNKDIIKTETSTIEEEVENIVYDDKNNPFQNIIGLDKIRYHTLQTHSIFNPNYYSFSTPPQDMYNIKNNLTNYQIITSTGEVNVNYSYTYNSENYPISQSNSFGTVIRYFHYQ